MEVFVVRVICLSGVLFRFLKRIRKILWIIFIVNSVFLSVSKILRDLLCVVFIDK